MNHETYDALEPGFKNLLNTLNTTTDILAREMACAGIRLGETEPKAIEAVVAVLQDVIIGLDKRTPERP